MLKGQTVTLEVVDCGEDIRVKMVDCGEDVRIEKVNESLGSKLNLTDENIKAQYRNSFDWFGYGVDDETVVLTKTINSVIMDENLEEQNEEFLSNDNIKVDDNEEALEDLYARALDSVAVNVQTTTLDQIVDLLKHNSKGMKASKIAEKLGLNKHEINKILYSHKDIFSVNLLHVWILRK